MKKIIFRVDDRLIHGQVIEGWINYYDIKNIILISDKVKNDDIKSRIFFATVPSGSNLKIMDIDEFNLYNTDSFSLKDYTLIIVANIDDIYDIRFNIPNGSYINIGCSGKFDDAIKITDYCYLDKDMIDKIEQLSKCFDTYIHKLPWDKHISVKKILKIRNNHEF